MNNSISRQKYELEETTKLLWGTITNLDHRAKEIKLLRFAFTLSAIVNVIFTLYMLSVIYSV